MLLAEIWDLYGPAELGRGILMMAFLSLLFVIRSARIAVIVCRIVTLSLLSATFSWSGYKQTFHDNVGRNGCLAKPSDTLPPVVKQVTLWNTCYITYTTPLNGVYTWKRMEHASDLSTNIGQILICIPLQICLKCVVITFKVSLVASVQGKRLQPLNHIADSPVQKRAKTLIVTVLHNFNYRPTLISFFYRSTIFEDSPC